MSALFRTKYQISIGKEYLVLGLSFAIESPVYGNSVLLEILDDAGRCISVPSALFEMVDGRCSALWEARFDEGMMTAWPSEFYGLYFHDRLSDGDTEARRVLQDIHARLMAEFTDEPTA